MKSIIYIISPFLIFLTGYYFGLVKETESECITCSYKNRCRYCIYE